MLLHVCPACGVVNEDVERAVAYRDEQIDLLREDVESVERELRGKRSQIKRLQREQADRLRTHPLYEDAMEVLEHWKRVISPSARELEGKRLEAVKARLEAGYTVAELQRCADGYALKPYVVNGRRTHEGPKDDWRADAELIFRDAKHVDQGIRIAERADDLRSAMRQPAKAPATGELSPNGMAALRFAGSGLFVFPVEAGGKRPVTMHGLKDATLDPDRIAACWRRWPDLNVAIRCGRESGLVVLDIDGEDGWGSLRALERAYEPVPTTASVVTPRGGQHLYFQHPDGGEVANTAGFPGPALDVRGDGGYVVAPPSMGADGRAYEVDDQVAIAPMPVWLATVLREYQRKVDAALDGSTDWVAFLNDAPSAGERNTRMTRYVGHLFAHGMNASEVFATARLLNTQAQPPLAVKELTTIVRSIGGRHARAAA